MGNHHIPSSYPRNQCRNLFYFHYVIGRGGFGKVWKVTFKKTNQTFALKQMSKVKIIDKKSENSVMYEKQILSQLYNPFIVNMKYSFQDEDHLYLIMDYYQGGDLRYHLCKYKTFSETQTKFYIACIITALQYIHSKNIMHRDLKPENLMLDAKGYVHITDFGVARNYHKNNKTETSGTPGYMAPEVLCGKNHNFLVDYYAIGVIGYECMFGHRPYSGRSRKEIREQVLSKQINISKHDLPKLWNVESSEFINKLLERKWSMRLGKGGCDEVKAHSWFKDFDWEGLKKFEVVAPFIPEGDDNFDKHYCNKKEVEGNETLERYSIYKQSELYIHAFFNYTCNHLNNNNEHEHKQDKQDINNHIHGYTSVSTSSTIKNNSPTKKCKFKLRNHQPPNKNNDSSSLCSISLKKLKMLQQHSPNTTFLSPHITIMSNKLNIKDNKNDKDNLPGINQHIMRKCFKKSASVNDLTTSFSPLGRNIGGNFVSSRASMRYTFYKMNKPTTNNNNSLISPNKNWLSVHKYRQCADMITSSHNRSKNVLLYNSKNNSNNNSNKKNNSNNTKFCFHCNPFDDNKKKNKDVKLFNKHSYKLK